MPSNNKFHLGCHFYCNIKKHLAEETAAHKLKRQCLMLVSLLLCVMIVIVGSISQVSKAQEYKLGYVPNKCIYFQNSVPRASAGSIIMNPLGYFISIYTNDRYLGTVFDSLESDTGRAGYHDTDANKSFGLGTQTQVWLDIRDGSELINRIKRDINKDAAQFVLDMSANKANGRIVINTVMCAAQLEGKGYTKQSGWSNQIDNIVPDIAYTQVKLKDANDYSTDQIVSDLEKLNYAYTYKEALAIQSKLQVLQINPTKQVKSASGASILSVTSLQDDIMGLYNVKNLNSRSFSKIFSNSTQHSIATDCYNLTCWFLGAKTTSSAPSSSTPTVIPDDKSEGGEIKTSVTGYNNFGQTSVLYSGQLGHFEYKFTNESYRIQKTKKVPEYTTISDSDGTRKVPVKDEKGKQVYDIIHYDEAPNFTKYNTGINVQGEHKQLASTNLSLAQYPSPTSTISRLICSNDLLDVNQNHLSGTCNSVSANTNSFRINYNTYTGRNAAGQESIAGRATMWTSDKKAYADSIGTMKIVPSDVEAYDITLEDAETGDDVEYPYVGEYLIPIYHYRNNTDVPVLAVAHGDTCDDYLDGNTDDFDTFTMGAGEEVTKEGDRFQVIKTGNESTAEFTLQCSVYLDEFDHDTSWESDGTNNIYQKSFNTLDPLAGYFIEPNSNYRENTDVISSFMVKDQTAYNITNSDKIRPILTVTYKQNGVERSQTVQYLTMVCPNQDENMIWFKWHVPTGLDGKAYFSLQLDPNSTFIDFDKWGDTRVTAMWTVDKEPICQTPDTAYAEAPASWFDSAVSKLHTSVSTFTQKVWPTKSWSIYKQSNNGSYYRQSYNLTVPSSFVSYIKPEGSPTAVYKNNKWYVKSGYGIDLATSVNSVEPGDGVVYNDYTKIQNCYVLFPEFMYDNKWGSASASYFNGARYGFKQPGDKWTESVNGGTFGTFTSLVRNGNAFNLPVNTAQLNYVHYTPVWFPDGPYSVKNYAYDVWTPAGMLSTYTDSNEIQIRGNMFSDYYVAGD